MALALGACAEGLARLILAPPMPPVHVLSAQGDRDQWLARSGSLVTAVFQDPQPLPPFPFKPAGHRVVVLGGSSVHVGGAVRVDDEFPDVIADTLAVEVLNLGAPGLDSFDLVELLHEASLLEPDVVVVYTGHNDFGNAYFQERFGGASGMARAWTRRGLEHLQVYCWLRRTLGPRDGLARGRAEGAVGPVAEIDALRRERTLDYLEANLRRLVWMARSAGARPILVTPISNVFAPPTSTRCFDACAQELFDQGRFSEARDADWEGLRAPGVAQERIRVVADELGVGLVDAEQRLAVDGQVPERLFQDSVHLSAEGHRALGELIAPSVAP